MKKIVTVLAAAVIAASTMSAADVALGVRGKGSMNVGTKFVEERSGSVEYPYVFGGGFDAYANLSVFNLGAIKLGVQPEIGMNFFNGISTKYTASALGSSTTIEVKWSTTTIDIPVLVTLKTDLGKKFRVGVGVGPYVSFVIDGKVEWEDTKKVGGTTSTSSDFTKKGQDGLDFSATNFGFAFDADLGFGFGPGKLVIDVRYMLDVTPTKVLTNGEDSDTGNFYRRNLTAALGYEIKI